MRPASRQFICLRTFAFFVCREGAIYEAILARMLQCLLSFIIHDLRGSVNLFPFFEAFNADNSSLLKFCSDLFNSLQIQFLCFLKICIGTSRRLGFKACKRFLHIHNAIENFLGDVGIFAKEFFDESLVSENILRRNSRYLTLSRSIVLDFLGGEVSRYMLLHRNILRLIPHNFINLHEKTIKVFASLCGIIPYSLIEITSTKERITRFRKYGIIFV